MAGATDDDISSFLSRDILGRSSDKPTQSGKSRQGSGYDELLVDNSSDGSINMPGQLGGVDSDQLKKIFDEFSQFKVADEGTK